MSGALAAASRLLRGYGVAVAATLVLMLGIAAAATAVAPDRAEPAAQASPAEVVPLEIAGTARAAELPGNVVAGARIHGRGGGALAAQPMGGLMGWLAPVAVPSADGRAIAYSTWRDLRPDDPQKSWAQQGIEPGDALAVPSLRLYDLTTRADTLVAEGAFSAAWRADGALAYVRGSPPEYRAGERYLGDIVVRGPAGGTTVWSLEADRYVVAAWAGQTLIAYRVREGEHLDLVALDGPGRHRELAGDTHLVAVSPDGKEAFVTDGSALPGTVRVIDVATGRERAALALASVSGAPVTWVGYAGSWTGDLVAARSDAGLAVFRVGEEIRLERLLQLDPEQNPGGVIEPRFVGGSARVVARTSIASGPEAPRDDAASVLLDCDVAAARCGRTEPLPARAWLRFAYNPSRPQKGER